MTVRTILTPLHASLDATPQLDAALSVAARFHGCVDALYVRPNPAAELAYVNEGMALPAIDYAALDARGRERAGHTRAAFDAWCSGRPGAARVATWIEQEGFLDEVMERRGRLADLLVIRRPAVDEDDTDRAFDVGVFSTGRPCLLVSHEPPADLFHHVIVAWNGSLEAARAVAGAMPILAEAAAVSVFHAPEHEGEGGHGAELARALARHGIAARRVPVIDRDEGAGTALLAAAERAGATLIVMGAFTHSRLRERLLGGATRHVLAHATLPVLMAH